MSKQYDCIIIGAGHNGLTAAVYLAKAGKSVLVLESQERIGGAAASRSFAPGYAVSACAHLLHGLPEQVINELELRKHGLRFSATNMGSHTLSAGAATVSFAQGSLSGTQLSQQDLASYAEFMRKMNRFAGVMLHIMKMVPPRLSFEQWSERLRMLTIGWKVRTLGKRDMREFLRIIGMNMYDLLTEHFENPALRGAVALDAALGAEHGPRSPGTVLNYLYRLAGQLSAGSNGISQIHGGLGGLSEALRSALTAAGGELRTGAPVARIEVANDKISGVTLVSGESIQAGAVLSSADPQTTLLKLLGTAHLDTGFVRKVHHLRNRGLAAKLHLALSGLPSFKGLVPAQAKDRLLIAPDLNYVENAFNPSKYREVPEHPVMEIVLPSLSDPSCAPTGHHVLSAIVQYVPYDLGADPAAARAQLRENILRTLEQVAPDIRQLIVADELLTPSDLEAEFGMRGGHWHHAALSFDQFFFTRPVPGAAQYSAPVAGLYLCGAGAHPGGGVMGLAGKNAAQQLLSGGQ